MGYTSPTTTAAYAYDALDRRVAKTVDGVVTAYVYDTSAEMELTTDDILLEYQDDVLIRRWVHTKKIDEPIGFELYVNDSTPGNGTAHEVYAGRQGSIAKVVDTSTGLVVAEYGYDVFGLQSVTIDAAEQLFGYTGRPYDAESGLNYFRSRYLSPDAGRFIQADPIEFDGGSLNIYAYVGNNPQNFTDPSGLAKRKGGSPRTGGTSSTSDYIIDVGTDIMREAAIEAVATGVFNLAANITGMTAFSGAQLDAIASHVSKSSGGKPNMHHCWPVYQSGDRKQGPLKKILRNRHKLVHKMMQEYMGVYSMKYTSIRSGQVIRRQLNKAYMRKVSRQFYDDMYMVFRVDFGC